MGKSAAANWAGRWARGGRPDPLLGSSVPDRAKEPKRQGKLTCANCGSDVTMTKKSYGGMQRFVCTDKNCSNSEAAFKEGN